MIVEVKKIDKKYIAIDLETKEEVLGIPEWMLRKAVKYNRLLKRNFYSNGKPLWRQVDIKDYIDAKENNVEVPELRKNKKERNNCV